MSATQNPSANGQDGSPASNAAAPSASSSRGNSTSSVYPLQPPRLSLELEPNPFEMSFKEREKTGPSSNPPAANAVPQYVSTPGGRRHLLPPVTAISSPQSLLQSQTTPGSLWMNSLRSGPLSPAMLQGPQPSNSQVNGTEVEGISRPGPLSPFGQGIGRGLLTPDSSTLFNPPGPNTAAILGMNTDQFMSGSGLTPLGLSSTQPPPKDKVLAQNNAPNTAQGTTLFGPVDPTDAANSLYMLSRSSKENNADSATAASTDKTESKSKQAKARPSRRKDGIKKEADESSPPYRIQKKRASESSVNDFKSQSPESQSPPPTGQGGSRRKLTDEEKRKSFLERNRVAALKCRQRKKQWLENLQAKVEYFSSENESLNTQVATLREQVLSLKTILLQHKDCPLGGISQENFAAAINPSGAPPPAQQQPQQQQQDVGSGQQMMPGQPMPVMVPVQQHQQHMAAAAAAHHQGGIPVNAMQSQPRDFRFM